MREKESLLLAGATSSLVVIAFAIGVVVGAPPVSCSHHHPFTIDGGPTMIAPVSPMVIPDRDADGGGEVFYFREDGYPMVVRYEREVRIGGER